MNKTSIRSEQPADTEAITRVTELAFQSAPHSSQTEHFIVLALRRAGALSVSLVAEKGGQVVGHAAFSPVQISDGSPDWYGLGPVSVLPEHQHQGIGRALIHEGLAALRALGVAGCVVLGEPGYYGRFGFKHRPDCVLEGVPPEYFQVLAFGPHVAAGRVSYHEAFNAKG
ncbi:GNAT family N-acetyltransferase [Variovorax terrae]|uniref:N-acetyltransferase n=1 Tax=Variovorax terrae TaxID=2923278 RepID=A0A9X2AMM0_9BURK|nr:N-acetyltransferase [Variovorax terrae]MCJ0763504.1 N-acetyltransferase [Variovorax terrae]